MNKKTLLTAAAVSIAVFFAAPAARAMGKKPPRAVVGSAVPEFYLQKEDGGEVAFSDLRAAAPQKPAVVVFFSYDCPISRLAVKSAQKFFETPEGSVAAAGVSPMPYETAETMRVYREEQKIPFELYRDGTGELAALFQVKTVPQFFVFGPDGVLRYRGGVAGMKRAVAAVGKGETRVAPAEDDPGCAVPERKVKAKKRKPVAAAPAVAPAPAEEKSEFPTDTTAKKEDVRPRNFPVAMEISHSKTDIRLSKRWGK